LIKKLQRKLNNDTNLKELLVGSAITFIFKIGGMLSGYLVIYFISKNIGAYGLGIYNLFNTILLLFSVILGLGFHMSILRFAGQFNRENHFGELKSLSKNIFKLVIPVSILISIFIYFSAEYWINLLGKPVSYIFPLKILSIILPFFTLQQIFIEFLSILF
jgi:O-antigen/teichoic acid export membrane protein